MNCCQNLWSACGFQLISNSITCKNARKMFIHQRNTRVEEIVDWKVIAVCSSVAACSVCTSNLGYNTKILPKAQIACFAYRIDVFISYCINILSISCRTANRHIFEHGTAHEEGRKKNTRIARAESGGEKWLCNIYLLLATVAWFFPFSPDRKWNRKRKMKNSMSEWKVNSAEAISSFLLPLWLLIEVKNLVCLATACTHENLN